LLVVFEGVSTSGFYRVSARGLQKTSHKHRAVDIRFDCEWMSDSARLGWKSNWWIMTTRGSKNYKIDKDVLGFTYGCIKMYIIKDI